MTTQFRYTNLVCLSRNVLNFMKLAVRQCIKYLKEGIVNSEII